MKQRASEQKANRSISSVKSPLAKPDLRFPLFDYSLTLSSFLSLHHHPFRGQLIKDGDLKPNPLVTVGVLGSSTIGKTYLITELERKFSAANKLYLKQISIPNALYLKSIANQSNSSSRTNSNILFIKAPSFHQPLNQIDNKASYKALLHDRELMNKFILGFFSSYSNILIFVVGENDKEYRKYYHEIRKIRRDDDYIIIVHNLAAANDSKKKKDDDDEIPKVNIISNNNININQSNNSSRTSTANAKVNNNINNRTKPSNVLRKIENSSMVKNAKQNTHVKIILKDTNTKETKNKMYNPIVPKYKPQLELLNVSNTIPEKELISSSLLNELENKEKYDKFNYVNLIDIDKNQDNATTNELEYYYCEKKNPQIIHLLYNPLPLKESSIAKTNVKHNTQMKKFLAGLISTHIRSKGKKDETIFDSFEKYLNFYISQIYEDQPKPALIYSNGEYKVDKECQLKQISNDIVNINSNAISSLHYSYNVIGNELVICLEKVMKGKMKLSGKIVGENNVITVKVMYTNEDDTNKIDIDDLKTNRKIVYSNCFNEEICFDILIPTEHCVISNYTCNVSNNNDGTITMKYNLLK